MLVRIEKDWQYPDFRRQSPGFAGNWDGITFTDEPVRECDLLIVLNTPSRDIKVTCPMGNRWLFTQESPIEIYRWHTDSFKYFDKVFTYWSQDISPNIIHDQTSLPWHIDKSFDDLMALSKAESLPNKTRLLSWVTSNATHKEGHKLRMAFKSYLEQHHVSFDLFGRGFTPIKDKFDGIYPYKYSLAIENYACDNYWTEKIADCFLAWTMPIYWGAKNILSYFPADSMILIDPSDPIEALSTIRSAIESGRYERSLDAIAESRNLILTKYQLFPHVRELAKTYINMEATSRHSYFIPTNPKHYEAENSIGMLKRMLKRYFL